MPEERRRPPRRIPWLVIGVVMIVLCAIVIATSGALSSRSAAPLTKPGVVSTALATNTGSRSITVDAPPHVDAGNLLIAQLSSTATGPDDVTPPDGWLLIRRDTSPGGKISQTLWYHVVSDNESGSFKFTLNDFATSSLALTNVSGARAALPIDAEVGIGSTGLAVTIPEATTMHDHELVLAFASMEVGKTRWHDPENMTQEYRASGQSDRIPLIMGHEWMDNAGSTGKRAFASNRHETGEMVGQAISIRPSDAVQSATPGATPSEDVVAGGIATPSPLPTVVAPATDLSGLSVRGNQLVNSSGAVVTFHGVNRSGTESGCVQGWGIFDGPSDDASIQRMLSWHINAVRIPLNEDCWLAINDLKPEYSGVAYRQAIVDFVTRLNQHGIYAILELHWSAPSSDKAVKQRPMPDRDHALEFWTSVATTFKRDSGAVFDLFNEPFPGNGIDSPGAWNCWSNGGDCDGIPYVVAGMQELVNAVRSTGAGNLILVGGTHYAHDLSGWRDAHRFDPDENLAAAWHIYSFNDCSSPDCWDQQIAPLAAQFPIVAGEMGEDDCSAAFVTQVMTWLDAHHQSYLAWTWDTWGARCSSMSLIQNYDGTPLPGYGQGVHDYLAGHWKAEVGADRTAMRSLRDAF
jgi:endoglucanase